MSLFRKIKTPVKLGVASVLIAILISQTDIDSIQALLLKTNLWLFIFAFLVMSTRTFIVALRWKRIAAANSIQRFPMASDDVLFYWAIFQLFPTYCCWR